MNATLSPNMQDDLDQTMRVVARNVAMGLHDLNDILEFCRVDSRDFTRWKDNPRFLHYLSAETEAWNNAQNVGERTKLKAGIIMEEWLPEAYAEMRDRKTALSQRTELAKLIAKIAGMGEPKGVGIGISGGEGGGGFTLQINIGNTTHVNYSNEDMKTIEASEEDAPVAPRIRAPFEIENESLGIPE